jgi:hypothetical protein
VTEQETTPAEAPKTEVIIQEARLWRGGEWTAKVIKNDSDDGWAVEMYREGNDEPALVGPWTMGRDKKNPKPLDQNAFNTLVKTATEVLQRHEHARRAALHKECSVDGEGGSRVDVWLDIVPDEDDPHAILSARVSGEVVAKTRVMPNFKLTQKAAEKWVAGGYNGP